MTTATENLEIRAAKVDDFMAVARKVVVLNEMQARTHDPSLRMGDTELTAVFTALKNVLADEQQGQVLLAEYEGELIGYIFIYLCEGVGFIQDLWVDEEYYGQPLKCPTGVQLFDKAMGWMEYHGATRVICSCAIHNDKTIEMLAKKGFHDTKRVFAIEMGS